MPSTRQSRQRNRQGRLGANPCSSRSADTHKLREAVDDIQPPSISDLIQNFDGDKYRTAYELTRDELGSTADVEEYKRAYKNMLGDINRYLKHQRTPDRRMKERFKRLYSYNKSLKVHIRGCVQVSNEYYYKDSTWNNPIQIRASDVSDFIQRTQDNIEDGYSMLNDAYMNNYQFNRSKFTHDIDIIWLDNVQIQMRF